MPTPYLHTVGIVVCIRKLSFPTDTIYIYCLVEPALATPPLYGIFHRDLSTLKGKCGYNNLCGGYEVAFWLFPSPSSGLLGSEAILGVSGVVRAFTGPMYVRSDRHVLTRPHVLFPN